MKKNLLKTTAILCGLTALPGIVLANTMVCTGEGKSKVCKELVANGGNGPQPQTVPTTDTRVRKEKEPLGSDSATW